MSIEEEFTIFACGRCLRSVEQDSRSLLKTVKQKIYNDLSLPEYNEFLGKIPQLRSKCNRLLEMVHADEMSEKTVSYRRLGRRISMHLRKAEQRLQNCKGEGTGSKNVNEEAIKSVDEHIRDIFNMKSLSDYFCTKQEMQNVLALVDRAIDGIEAKCGPVDSICDLLVGRVVRDKLCRSILDNFEKKNLLTTWSNIRKALVDWIASEEKIEARKIKPRRTTCYVCRKQHILLFCPDFRFMTVSERWELVRQVKVCANCFNARHSTENCDKLFRCSICGDCHNNLLHRTRRSPFEL